MSRFEKAFGRASSSSEDESSQEEEEKNEQQVASTATGKIFKADGDSSDAEERKVRSGKTKRLEALEKVLDGAKKHANIKDFENLIEDFDKLEKEIKSQSKTMYEEYGDRLPNSVLKTLMMMEESITETTKAEQKQMKTMKNKAYNKLKQRLKKYLAENGDGDMLWQTQLDKYKEDPQDSESEEEEESKKSEESKDDEESSEEEEEEESGSEKAAKKEEKKEQGAEEEDEYGDEYYDEEDDDEESDKSESEEEVAMTQEQADKKLQAKYPFCWKPHDEWKPSERRWLWVKKESLPEDLRKLLYKEKPKKVKKEEGENPGSAPGTGGPVVDEISKDEFITVVNTQQWLQDDYTITVNVKENLDSLKQQRLKGKFDSQYHAKVLQKMIDEMPAKSQEDVKLKINVIIYLVSTLFQTARSGSVLSREEWIQASQLIQLLLTLVDTPEFKAALKIANEVKVQNEDNDEEEVVETGMLAKKASSASRVNYEIERSVFPSLANFLERLDDQLFKSYQKVHHSSLQYLQRINDENVLLFLIDKVSTFLQEFELDMFRSRIAIIKLQYLYYKNDIIYEQIRQRIEAKGKNLAQSLKSIYILQNSQQEIAELVSQVHRHGNPRMRVRATLYQAYHHGLHNRLNEARDLLLKTHMSQVITVQHVDNQVLYNRALTQAGMAAFRLGDILQSHEILVEIYQNMRYKELLAQGFSRLQDKTAEAEHEEKRRQLPHHMKINLEVLESIHFITSMLIETPLFAENQHSLNKQVVSKSYRKLIEYYDQRAFVLAAEQPRDHIVFAARALNKSDWRTALKHIYSISALAKLIEMEGANLKNVLTKAFQESAMTSYIFMAAKQYKSFSLPTLSSMFEMDTKEVKKTVSKLIINNRLQAHIDRANDLIVIDQDGADINQLQQLSLQYVSKIENLVKNNERMVEIMNHSQQSAMKAAKKQPP